MGIQFNSGPMVKRHNYQQNAEMNITPFVDVMLVLLIIFMVAAPLLTVGVPVELPKSAAGALPTEPGSGLRHADAGHEYIAEGRIHAHQSGRLGRA